MTREELIVKAAKDAEKKIGLSEGISYYGIGFLEGAVWADEHPRNFWKNAQGDYLPEIDREAIVLCDDGHGGYKVCFGHRPNPKGFKGISAITGDDYYIPKTYDKGGWNIPDVRWWLDLETPNLEE